MCKSPITFSRKDARFEHLSDMRLKRYFPTLSRTAVSEVTVPCGKCLECLKKRQNDLSLRCMQEASKRGSMVFVTLTYNEEALPLSMRLQKIDTDTGEILSESEASPLVRIDNKRIDDSRREFISVCRVGLAGLPLGRSPRYFYIDCDEINALVAESGESSIFYRYCVTPSLHRRDVRLWLKRCRIRYKRQLGIPCPDFSYVVVGEYGPNTCRPHYHIAFFGLSQKDVSFFVAMWEYGFTNVKVVNAINQDGTNGFELASRYVGKYMTKGRFECESVKCAASEKPRLCASRKLGYFLDDRLLSYYRCYDLVGKYDIQTLRKDDDTVLSMDDLKKLSFEVPKRNFVPFGDMKYAIPNVIKKQIWYVPEVNPDGKKCYVASSVRVALSNLARGYDLGNDNERHFQRLMDSFSEEVPSSTEFVDFSSSGDCDSETIQEQAFLRFYRGSIF